MFGTLAATFIENIYEFSAPYYLLTLNIYGAAIFSNWQIIGFLVVDRLYSQTTEKWEPL